MCGHHIDPSAKERNFDTRSMSLSVLQAEMTKCVPMCMNHHWALHHELHHGAKDLPFDDLLALVREKYPA
jgi:hypothetical protein